MTIAPDLIALAESRGACDEALAWMRAKPRTLDDLLAKHRKWAEWAAVKLPLPDEVADYLHARGCSRSWWRNGERHREDGPAVEWSYGSREWWLHGVRQEDQR